MEWGYAVYPHFFTCNRNLLVVKYRENGKSKQRRNTCFASV